MALASLGRRDGTLREVCSLERFEAAQQDRHDSGPPTGGRACWRASAEADIALDLIERLAAPGLAAVQRSRVQLNPDFDLLRSEPRYQAILREYA